MKKDLDYLRDIIHECEVMAIEAKIQPGRISNIKINTRAKKRWGLCSYLSDGTYEIQISNSLLADDVSEEALMNTAMHEVLHTVKGCMNHKRKWKTCADIVNRKYGLNVKTTTSAEEKNIAIVDSEYKYIVQCAHCGHKYKYIRLSKCVKNPKRFRCGYCNGELTRIK